MHPSEYNDPNPRQPFCGPRRRAYPHFPIPMNCLPYTDEGNDYPHREVSVSEYILLRKSERERAEFYGDDPASHYRWRVKMRKALERGEYICTRADLSDLYESFPLCNRPDQREAA